MTRCLTETLLVSVCFSLLLRTTGWAAERPNPTRFEKAIVKIEERYGNVVPAQADVVFVGSSSIRMWNLDQSFPGLKAVNCGFGGSHLADSVHYADRLVKPFAPKCVVLYAGDNDIGKGLSVAAVVEDYKKCVAAFRKTETETKILYVAIKPSRKRWKLYPKMKAANEQIKQITEEDEHATFVDIASAMLEGVEEGPPPADLFQDDGLHLTPKGYAIWTDLVIKALPSALRPNQELQTTP